MRCIVGRTSMCAMWATMHELAGRVVDRPEIRPWHLTGVQYFGYFWGISPLQ